MRLLTTLAATTISEYCGDLLLYIMTAQEIELLATYIWPSLVDILITDKYHRISINLHLTCKKRWHVPTALNSRQTRNILIMSKSGQFGALTAAHVISDDFVVPALDWEILKNVASCKWCHQIKTPCGARNELHRSHPLRCHASKELTMGFVTDLSESTAVAWTWILPIINCWTKMSIDLPWRYGIACPALPPVLFNDVICECSVPDNITTNHCKEFTSQLSMIGTMHSTVMYRLLTAFHPPASFPDEAAKPNNWLLYLSLLQQHAG